MDIPSARAESTLEARRYGRVDDLAGAAKHLDRAPDAKLQAVAQQFEGFFLSMLMKEMRAAIPKNGLFSGGRGEEVFTDVLDQRVTEAAAKHGKGLGIAKMIVDHYRRLAALDAPKTAGESGAGAADGSRFEAIR